MDVLTPWLFISIITILSLLYRYLNRHFYYWSKRGIKGPKPLPIVGNLLSIFLTSQLIQDCEWSRKYGKIYGYYFGNKPVLTVTDPELIKAIMIKDFHIFTNRRLPRPLHPLISLSLGEAVDEDWRRIRTIVSPTFSSGKMRRMYELVNQCSQEFVNKLTIYAKEGKEFNIKKEFGNHSMDIISTCAFATKVNVHGDHDCEFVVNLRNTFNFFVLSYVPFLFIPEFLHKYIKNAWKSAEEPLKFFKKSINAILEERRKKTNNYNDFIQLLLEAQKGKTVISSDVDTTDNTSESHHVNGGEEQLVPEKIVLNSGAINKYLTDDEILAQAFMFFFAGFDTSATSLSFGAYELALNPEIQEKLYQEINASVDSNGDIGYEELTKLPYLDAVVSEILRLHAPALRTHRVPAIDYMLGDTGICLEKGVTIEVPIYAIHLSPEFYENPEKFDPDRFMPENRHKIKPYTYIPFGVGPRHCAGNRFALLEEKLTFAHLIRKFRFVTTTNTEIPLKQKRAFRINSPKSIILAIEIRVNN